MKQKAFFIIFKWLSLKQIKQIFLGRGESDFNKERNYCGFLEKRHNADAFEIKVEINECTKN